MKLTDQDPPRAPVLLDQNIGLDVADTLDESEMLDLEA